MEKIPGSIIIVAILIFFVFVIGVIGLFTNTNMQTYSGEGVSFNVPPNWRVLKDEQGKSKAIQVVDNNSSDVQVAISISNIPNNESDQEMISTIQNSMITGSKSSFNTISINGNTGYESIYPPYSTSQSPEPVTDEEVLIIKNGMLYDIIFEAPTNEFNYEQSNFNITLNSFKI
jgi:hypothetical protein